MSALDPDLVAGIDADLARAFARDSTDHAIVVLDGIGVRLVVRFGHLVAEDGMGRHHRERRFTRALAPRRVMILASEGMVTLDALSWCRAAGTEVVVLDPRTDTLRFVSVPCSARSDGRLLRAQAVAGSRDDHPTGVAITRHLLEVKLFGQARIARDPLEADDAATVITDLHDALADATDVEQCRQWEASASAAYFAAWTGHEATSPHFAPRDTAKIPRTWHHYDGRRSLVAKRNSNRRASHPVNGVLNYLAGIAKSEAVLAARIIGLDPDMGMLHTDGAGKPGMALDLLEVCRPAMESYTLSLLSSRTFKRSDFLEQPDGSVRLGASLRQELAATAPMWARELAPHAETVAKLCSELIATDYRPSAPLSGAKRRAGQRRVKTRKASRDATRLRVTAERRSARLDATQPSLWACPECGGVVSDPRRIRCDDCIEADPKQMPELRKSRGAAISSRKHRQRDWQEANPSIAYDPELFRRDILPKLVGVKLSAIVEATGLSKGYSSQVRAGKFTPNVQHWGALAELAGVKETTDGTDPISKEGTTS